MNYRMIENHSPLGKIRMIFLDDIGFPGLNCPKDNRVGKIIEFFRLDYEYTAVGELLVHKMIMPACGLQGRSGA